MRRRSARKVKRPFMGRDRQEVGAARVEGGPEILYRDAGKSFV